MRKKERRLLICLMAAVWFLKGWLHYDLALQAEAEETETMGIISLSAVKNDAGMTTRDTEGAYYFGTSLSVIMDIADETGNSGEIKSSLVLKRNGTVISENVTGPSYVDMLSESGTYEYTMEDADGNISADTITIAARKENGTPSAAIRFPDTAVSVDKDLYFRDTPDLFGEISDSLGIAKIEYKKGDENSAEPYSVLRDYSENGVYAAGKNQSYHGSLKLSGLQTELEAASDGTYSYTFRVTNVIGAETMIPITLKVDRTATEAQVFVAYDTDKDGSSDSDPVKGDTGVQNFLDQDPGKIFGKETIRFHIYVKDGTPVNRDITAVSGIDTEELISAVTAVSDGVALKDLKIVDGSTASFTYENVDYTGYTHLTGRITLPAGAGIASARLKITELKDRAGNVMDQIDCTDITGTTVLYLDNVCPILKSFVIDGDVCRESDGEAFDSVKKIPVYYNREGDDVVISFEIEDNETDWNPNAVVVQVLDAADAENPVPVKTTGEKEGALEIIWAESGDVHTAVFGFDGEPDKEGIYEVRIYYEDRAGNVLTGVTGEPALTGSFDKQGTYVSTRFILDHEAPKFSITYTEAVRQVGGDGRDHETLKTPVAGYTSYYRENIVATISVKETCITSELQGGRTTEIPLKNFVFEVNGEDAKADIVWDVIQDSFCQGRYIMEEDGDYEIRASCSDASGNKLAADIVQGSLAEGEYISPKLVRDTVAPVIGVDFDKTPVHIRDGRGYFHENTIVCVTVSDQNFRVKEIKDQLLNFAAYDSLDRDLYSHVPAAGTISGYDETVLVRGTWKAEIPLSYDANYDIPVACTDLAGNPAVWKADNTRAAAEDYMVKACVDKEAPELSLSCIMSNSEPLDVIGYKSLGFWFADRKLTLKADAADATAGIRMIRFTVTDEKGKVHVYEKTFVPQPSACYEIAVPLSGDDFKGTVEAQVMDWSDWEEKESHGSVVESAMKHSEISRAAITTVTKPSRTVGGVDYYNTDIELNLNIQDTYSGLGKISYRLGNADVEIKDYKKEANREAAPGKAITNVFDKNLILAAGKNNQNEVLVKGEFTDNAGHTGSVEKRYNIDISKPVVTVVYDLNTPSNEKYYNQTRQATVTIKERNFDENDVQFHITNTLGDMPSISGWSTSGTGDDTVHTCTVTFSKDGDYTFTLGFVDQAGNQADYNRIDAFTIDQTKPVMTISYDNNQSLNEYYYAKTRTAVIDIWERNFEPALIQAHITAENGMTYIPTVSGWSQNGEHHTATVSFLEDAEYTFDIEGQDLAGNLMDDYPMDRFVIDMTEPELEIFDIEHMSANNGAVMPGVRYSDTNYDLDGMVIQMKGCNNGVQELNGKQVRTADGLEMKLNDFEYCPEVDDIYTMDVTVYDLAGNSRKDSVIFSVNRFGSVYTFDDATEALTGKNGRYYTSEEQRIVVTETNADTLEFREITCNLNGVLRTLKEGEDYTVKETGNALTWKQYTYTIDRKNFEEEGIYILSIYSEDRATNASDNHTGGKKIEFAVDKTEPGILISGIENNGAYRKNRHEITLDVQDNICLSDVEVLVNGKKTVYPASEISELDGRIVLLVESANRWQHLKVTAHDAAGNKGASEEIRFLITPSFIVQFFMNQTVFYSTVFAAAVLGTGGWWFRIRIRKRK